MLSWNALTGALSYNLYRVAPSGDYTLFQNVVEPKYTLYLASGAVAYENFAVKALCDAKTESPDFAKAVKVRTGPNMLAILIILSGIA
jgi:hypothetical protein